MDEAEFDRAVVAAVFEQAALRGWAEVSLVEAGVQAGLDLRRLRARFPGKAAVLLRFGVMADQAALGGATDGRDAAGAAVRRGDEPVRGAAAASGGRAGADGGAADRSGDSLLLYGATLRSMGWLLEAAGVPTIGHHRAVARAWDAGALALCAAGLGARRERGPVGHDGGGGSWAGPGDAGGAEHARPGAGPVPEAAPTETGPDAAGEEPSPAGP